jgi:hypothetical protein
MNHAEAARSAIRRGAVDEAKWHLSRLKGRMIQSLGESISRLTPGNRGLGSAIAEVVSPVAEAIQAVTGKPCGGCEERKAALDAAVPNPKFSDKKN